MDIGCIVLVGGRGERLGQDKTLETIGSRSLLEHVLRRLSFLDTEILLVTASGDFCSPLFSRFRLRAVSDVYPGCGPLGGIYTGLRASGAFYNFVIACDMPFLNRGLLDYMAGVAPGYDLVVPRFGELVEPLHAVYSQDCLTAAARLLKAGRYKVQGLFDEVRVRYLDEAEIERFDPDYLSFFNVNTKSDLAKARRLLEEER